MPSDNTVYKKLLYDLFRLLSKDADVSEINFLLYTKALTKLKADSPSVLEWSETSVVENIKIFLKFSDNALKIERFEDLHKRLKCAEFLMNREAVLYFLLCLGRAQKNHVSGQPKGNITNDFHSLSVHQQVPSTQKANMTLPLSVPNSQSTPSLFESWNAHTPSVQSFSQSRGNTSSQPSGKKSSKLHSTHTASNVSSVPMDHLSFASRSGQGDSKAISSFMHVQNVQGASNSCMMSKSCITWSKSAERREGFFPISSIKSELVPESPPEHLILQDLIFCFQGIPGTLLKIDPVTLGFKLDPKFSLSRPVRRSILRLTELGWLHNKLRRFCEEAESSRSLGLVEKSLIGALREQLTEYYRLVAILQADQKKQTSSASGSPLSEDSAYDRKNYNSLTLQSLSVWVLEPMEHLRCLVAITEDSNGLKGGALASAVYSFLQSGDPVVHSVARHLLAAVCKPLYLMLSRWVVDGELEDPYGEFFIAADCQVTGERLWYDKYRVQSNLVPSFVPMTEANKILATGKSINFLREVCQDQTPIHGRDMLRQALDSAHVEALFTPDQDGDLRQVMEMAYREVSRRVLEVLSGPHKFLENLHALRRYLLLGQGDFIRYLMEIINPELCKPASHLYVHNLSGILETARRATNAQFEDPEILRRLDVRLLELNAGDIGWDVFTLDYHFSGPISTIFVPNASSYLMLFSTLWRAKRSEYILTGSWKRQTTAMRTFRHLRELAPVMQRTHLLTAEMIHLVQQMQYYMLFEVLECSWHEMLDKLDQAESLDDILKAHVQFLNKTKAGALLDHESKRLAARLRVVHSLVLDLEKIETDLHSRACQELAARNIHERTIENRGDTGEFGTNLIEEENYQKARTDFKKKYLRDVLTKLTILANDYQEQVKNFLLELADHPNNNLQLLSFRLDFNDHYKRREPRLVTPYTYQHRRLSEMGHQRNSLNTTPVHVMQGIPSK